MDPLLPHERKIADLEDEIRDLKAKLQSVKAQEQHNRMLLLTLKSNIRILVND